ncbi:MAG: cell division FtsA domain-containing protein [Patescibacteria group bacterium]|nr:cell division FtsA domain-containing protein [bacterium]MDZ4227466.1 cell division FtsA domain-containing protein [Patescibacteria group bacterium]
MRKFYTGIDIGTYHVKVVIAAPAESPDLPMSILATSTAGSRGLRHGYIIDTKEASKAIREALGRASAAAKVRVQSARVGVGGVGLDEIHSTAEISLTPAGGIVSKALLDRALYESEKRAMSRLTNRTVIHNVPLGYRVDGEKVWGSPLGLQGTKLAVDTLLVTMLSQHHDDLIEAVENAGVEVEGVMASPMAASLVTLSKSQKTAGVVLANIGSETLSILIFDEDTPVSLKVFPIGSSSITEMLALSFRIPLPEAESLKRGGVTGSDIPERKMQAILTAQLKEMYALINAHLKTIGRHRLLPAGIVITGGGSGVTSASEIARLVLRLPAQVGQVGFLPRSANVDATWSVAYGLCRWAYAEDMEGRTHTLGEVMGNAWVSLKRGMRSLLP